MFRVLEIFRGDRSWQTAIALVIQTRRMDTSIMNQPPPPIEFDTLVFNMTSWLFQRLQDEGQRQGLSRAMVSGKIQQQVHNRLVLEDAIDLVTGELGNGTIH